jgi:type IV secretion system protein VirB10
MTIKSDFLNGSPDGCSLDQLSGKKDILSRVRKVKSSVLVGVIATVAIATGATLVAMMQRAPDPAAVATKAKDEPLKEMKAANSAKTLADMGATNDDDVAKAQALKKQKETEREAKEAAARLAAANNNQKPHAPATLPNGLPAPAGVTNQNLNSGQVSMEDKMAAQQDLERKKQAEELIKAAFNADTTVSFSKSGGSSSAAVASRDKLYDAALQKMQGGAGGAMMPAVMAGQGGAKSDVERKEAFLEKANQYKDEILLQRKRAPLSAFEVKAGGVIPAILETAINSDLPGMVTARITESVYDTVTGRQLMIPQGSKVVGMYDSDTVYGQERVLLVWNRIIYPDGSSINIEGMQGADSAGQSGFADEVDRHFFRAFQSALLMSMLSAGIQQSQAPQQTQINQQPSAGQTMGQEMGRMMGQLGMEIVRKGLNLKPTITVRAGYQFNIMVNKDMVFDEPYGD